MSGSDKIQTIDWLQCPQTDHVYDMGREQTSPDMSLLVSGHLMRGHSYSDRGKFYSTLEYE